MEVNKGSGVVKKDVVKEITKEEAQNLHDKLMKLKEQEATNYIQAGKILRNIRNTKAWSHLGYKSFEKYLESPNVSMQRANAYRCISTYEKVLNGIVTEKKAIEIGIAKMEYTDSIGVEKASRLSLRKCQEEKAKHDALKRGDNIKEGKYLPEGPDNIVTPRLIFPKDFWEETFKEAREKWIKEHKELYLESNIMPETITDSQFIQDFCAEMLSDTGLVIEKDGREISVPFLVLRKFCELTGVAQGNTIMRKTVTSQAKKLILDHYTYDEIVLTMEQLHKKHGSRMKDLNMVPRFIDEVRRQILKKEKGE